jgi:PAS domain S-box-containing protein
MPPSDHGLPLDPQVLRAVLDGTRLLILVADRDGLVRAANGAVERATGLAEEALRRPIWELAELPDERVSLQKAFSPLAPDALPLSILFHLSTTGDTSRVVDWDLRVLSDDGEASAVVFAGIDLSDRLAAEQHLREGETVQRLLLERMPAVVWTTDRNLRFTYSTGGGLASLGLGSDQLTVVGTSLYSYFRTRDPSHPGIAPHLRALEGESVAFDLKWHDRFFHARIEPLRDQRENIVGCIGLALDVTEQTRTGEALKTSETRLRRLVDSNVIGIVFWNESGGITEANGAFLRLVGFGRDELLSDAFSWRDLTPPEYRALDEQALAQLRSTGKSTPFEKEYVTKDGTRVPVLVGAARVDDSRGGPLESVAFILDLREQVRLRRARDQLLAQEQRARIETETANARLLLLVEGSKRLARTLNASETLQTLASVVVPALADWSYVVHRGWDGGPTAVASAHGDPRKQRLLRQLDSYVPDPAAPDGAARVFRSGDVALYSDIAPEQLAPSPPGWPVVGTRDPECLHLFRELGMKSLLCVPISSRSRVDAVMMLVSTTDPHRYDAEDIVLARDLAARAGVSLENGRLLSDALDAVRVRDEFLAIAAHELRTPLTSMLLHFQVLGRALDRGRLDPGSARQQVAAAETQARRLSALVDGLLDVARLSSHRIVLRIEEVDLGEVVDAVMATLGADFQRAGCTVSVRMPGNLRGYWDRMRIEQVLTNLLSNAMKFGKGRPIEVNVEPTGAEVRISVRDHGIGISKEDRTRIFGRFERAVSTRHFGGLGLGLYISVQILRAHHGSLHVESEPGQGSCFIVELPRGLQRAASVAELPS